MIKKQETRPQIWTGLLLYVVLFRVYFNSPPEKSAATGYPSCPLLPSAGALREHGLGRSSVPPAAQLSGVEGQRADLLTVQCDLHPSAAFRGHTQCGIVLNTCSFFTHIMLAIHLPMQLLLRSRNSPRMLLYRLK